jgi:5-methylcytosine-specific restriction endonuclease McrA
MKRNNDHVKAQKEGKIRDGYVCQICGSEEHVEGHHIVDVQYGGASSSDNIITLCKKCHMKVHKGQIDISLF